jgi:hypothetical protein
MAETIKFEPIVASEIDKTFEYLRRDIIEEVCRLFKMKEGNFPTCAFCGCPLADFEETRGSCVLCS